MTDICGRVVYSFDLTTTFVHVIVNIVLLKFVTLHLLINYTKIKDMKSNECQNLNKQRKGK